MSLSITFQGNIYNTDGIEFITNEVKYQAYYHSDLNPLKNRWSQIRLSDSGQYSIDLGDGDFLTQEGRIDSGDKVIICLWTPNSSNRLSTNLVEWSSLVFTLGEMETYIQDVQIRKASHPNNYFSLSDGDYRLNKVLTLMDEGTNDNHIWSFAQCIHYQYFELLDVEIFKMNYLINNNFNIYWGDTNEYSKVLGNSYDHSYSNIGEYTIWAEVFNVSGLFSRSEFSVKVRFNIPLVDFLLDNENPFPLANLGLGQIVNINNNSNSVDNDINDQNWLFDWSVIDDGYYGISTELFYSKLLDFNPSHQWINPGIFPITLTLNWFDGFDNIQISKTKYVNQQVWNIQNGLTWDTPVMKDIEEVYIPSITGSSGISPSVDYEIDDMNQFVDLGPTEEFNWSFDISGIHQIKQTIRYNDGFEERIKEEIFIIDMQTIADYKYEKYGCGHTLG